jgi:hypothetical protein
LSKNFFHFASALYLNKVQICMLNNHDVDVICIYLKFIIHIHLPESTIEWLSGGGRRGAAPFRLFAQSANWPLFLPRPKRELNEREKWYLQNSIVC